MRRQVVDIKIQRVITEYRAEILEDQSGESLFLRKLVLGIPAQASGKNLTRPLGYPR
jgi:hypothetical protein